MKFKGNNLTYICGSCGLPLKEHAMFKRNEPNQYTDIDVSLPQGLLHYGSGPPYRQVSLMRIGVVRSQAYKHLDRYG